MHQFFWAIYTIFIGLGWVACHQISFKTCWELPQLTSLPFATLGSAVSVFWQKTITVNTHGNMSFLLYELGNRLEWVNDMGILIPETNKISFLLFWVFRRHFVKYFVRQPLNRIFLISWEQTRLIEGYLIMNSSRFIGAFRRCQHFLHLFSQKSRYQNSA